MPPEAEDFEPYRNLKSGLQRAKKGILSLGGIMDGGMSSGNESSPAARRSDAENAAARRESESPNTRQQNEAAQSMSSRRNRSVLQGVKDQALAAKPTDKPGFGLKKTARAFLGG